MNETKHSKNLTQTKYTRKIITRPRLQVMSAPRAKFSNFKSYIFQFIFHLPKSNLNQPLLFFHSLSLSFSFSFFILLWAPQFCVRCLLTDKQKSLLFINYILSVEGSFLHFTLFLSLFFFLQNFSMDFKVWNLLSLTISGVPSVPRTHLFFCFSVLMITFCTYELRNKKWNILF